MQNNNGIINIASKTRITIITLIVALSSILTYAKGLSITIHLRGVYESNISLLSLASSGTMKPFTDVQNIKNGETTKLQVPEEKVPGEFVLRFDYKEKKESTPYPTEKNIIINDQDLELWVSPMYSNNPDSTWFQEGERENTAFGSFSKDNSKKKEKLGLLQQFLMNYDDTKSKFYKEGIEEYEQRRQAYNHWLDDRVKEDKAMFVSSLYSFQYVPRIPWEGTERERLLSLIDHYFDRVDLNDPAITKTSHLNDWMNSYVNLYGQMITTVILRDSLIPLAAKTAIEKARKGNPQVFGWMVDYFYRGFESNNIPAGMKILETYLEDPNCLTSKRMEIERRLKGMQTLVPRSMAPDFELRDSGGNLFKLYNYIPSNPEILLLFWSADCSHCDQTIDAIYPWLQKPKNKKRISVVAVSLDETETEIKKWDQKIPQLSGWMHLRAIEGVRSKLAKDYYILATPVMILLDAKSKEIIATPDTPEALVHSVK